MQASSPSARNAASHGTEQGSDAEPLQLNAARHKTYSESELAEMETGVHTANSLYCMLHDHLLNQNLCLPTQWSKCLEVTYSDHVYPRSCSTCKQAVYPLLDLETLQSTLAHAKPCRQYFWQIHNYSRYTAVSLSCNLYA